jgi:hypothetical protein
MTDGARNVGLAVLFAAVQTLLLLGMASTALAIYANRQSFHVVVRMPALAMINHIVYAFGMTCMGK